MANEQDSRVAVVHGYFPEGGDSILRACEAVRQLRSCKTTNEFL